MKKIIIITTLVYASMFNALLMAGTNSVRGDNYWIAELGQATFGEDATFPLADEADDIYVNFAFGYRFNTYISAEANLWWWQLNHKTEPDQLSTGGEFNFESGTGVSLRGDFPIYKKLSGFAQASYNMLNIEIIGQKRKEHDSGLGYSGGLEYDLKQGAVFFRYAVLLDNEYDPSEFKIEDLTSMGVGYKWDLPF